VSPSPAQAGGLQEHLLGLRCIRCDTPAGFEHFDTGCPQCAERNLHANLATVYDLDRARGPFEAAIAGDRRGVWRYDALLPFTADEAVTLGEGGTPLVDAPRLARHLGLRRVWIKDESRNPTWSFKDRSASLAATDARRRGSPAMVVASTGNAAAAVAAYARRAGLPAIVLFARGVDPIMAAFVRSYGPMLVATATKANRWVLMRHCVGQWGCYPAGSFAEPPLGANPFMIDGYKSIGFEIWEQLDRRLPDWVFGPSGYTNALFGILKSFRELAGMGFVDDGALPRIGVAEAYGSLSRAIANDSEVVEAADLSTQPPTVAISMGTAQNAYQGLLTIRSTGGSVAQVSNDAILEAQRLLAETEGIFGETASATGLAALVEAAAKRTIDPDSEVVVLLTSTGLKTLGVTSDLSAEPPFAADVDEFADVLSREYGFAPPPKSTIRQ
jgi:threonine synthase